MALVGLFRETRNELIQLGPPVAKVAKVARKCVANAASASSRGERDGLLVGLLSMVCASELEEYVTVRLLRSEAPGSVTNTAHGQQCFIPPSLSRLALRMAPSQDKHDASSRHGIPRA